MYERFVFFDLGNVLVNFDHEIAVRQLAELTNRSPDVVRQVVFRSGLQDRYETGLISCEQFAGIVLEQLQTQRSHQDILEAISAIFEPNEAIEKVLRWLTSAGVPLGILSNTCKAHWDWLRHHNWPVLDGWFRHQVLSFEVNSMKPDDGIYACCEQLAGCNEPHIFFMDDRVENVAAAVRRGWTARQFRHVDELTTQLVDWLASTEPR